MFLDDIYIVKIDTFPKIKKIEMSKEHQFYKWACVVKWFKASAMDDGLYHSGRQSNPGCCVRSGFKFRQG